MAAVAWCVAVHRIGRHMVSASSMKAYWRVLDAPAVESVSQQRTIYQRQVTRVNLVGQLNANNVLGTHY